MAKKIAIVFVFMFSVFLLRGVRALAVLDCSDVSYAKSNESQCQNELTQLNQQLAQLSQQLADQQKQTGTLKGDITALTTQINALKTKIQARSIVIAQLNNSINEKITTISSLSNKIDGEKESLAQLLRNTNEFDNENTIYLILSDATISDFYSDLESYDSIKKAVKSSVEKITGMKNDTEQEKQSLQTEQNAEMDAKAELESAQKKVVQSETDKKQLLAISKNKESAYQLLVAQKKTRADKISAALFQLRDTKAIPFGTALTYAKEVGQKTGVSPAFLLAIITQESNLGTDSGSCYVTDFNTGNGMSSKSGKIFSKVMNPTRDVPPFMDITKSLGRDPAKTLVSCPIGGYGYGGAMGPAQFIPSTWKLFQDRVASTLGISVPDPWNPLDAFMASGLYLSDLGANGNSYSSEMKAACSYYSGKAYSTCAYGRSVMSKASSIQDNIDYIAKNG
jgi:membrane-bound lytic murein transglycosylase B